MLNLNFLTGKKSLILLSFIAILPSLLFASPHLEVGQIQLDSKLPSAVTINLYYPNSDGSGKLYRCWSDTNVAPGTAYGMASGGVGSCAYDVYQVEIVDSAQKISSLILINPAVSATKPTKNIVPSCFGAVSVVNNQYIYTGTDGNVCKPAPSLRLSH